MASYQITRSLYGRDFPDSPVVKTLRAQFRGLGLTPGQGTKSHMPQLRAPLAAKKKDSTRHN